MKEYHKYIYDLEKKEIVGDFEGAYKNCNDVWPTQHDMKAPHFSYLRGFLQELKLEKGHKPKVVDIGCGYGDFVYSLQRLGVAEVTGVDVSLSAIKKGKETFGESVDLRQGDITKGLDLPDNFYDVTLVLGVFWFFLDHLNDVFNEIKRINKKDSLVVFTIHVPENPIRNDIIKNYDDFLKLVEKEFEILTLMQWYQETSIHSKSDILVLCKV